MTATTRPADRQILQAARAATTSTSRSLREVFAFVATTVALLALTTGVAVAEGADIEHLGDASPLAQTALFGTAFVPGIAAIVARLVAGAPLRTAGWGFRRWSWGAAGAGYVLALALVLPAAAIVWVTGLGGFDSAALADEVGMPAGAAVAVALTLGALPFIILAIGEEVAWRGSILLRLTELTTPVRATLITGVLWSLFHFPLMFFVDGAVVGQPLLLAALCFGVSNTAMSFPLSALRFRTGSLWPVILSHALLNSLIMMLADPATTDTGDTAWFAGETGIVIAATSVLVAVASLRFRLLRVPGPGEPVQ